MCLSIVLYILDVEFHIGIHSIFNTKCLKLYILIHLLRGGTPQQGKWLDIEGHSATEQTFTKDLVTWLAIERRMCGCSCFAQMCCVVVFTGAISIQAVSFPPYSSCFSRVHETKTTSGKGKCLSKSSQIIELLSWVLSRLSVRGVPVCSRSCRVAPIGPHTVDSLIPLSFKQEMNGLNRI